MPEVGRSHFHCGVGLLACLRTRSIAGPLCLFRNRIMSVVCLSSLVYISIAPGLFTSTANASNFHFNAAMPQCCYRHAMQCHMHPPQLRILLCASTMPLGRPLLSRKMKNAGYQVAAGNSEQAAACPSLGE